MLKESGIISREKGRECFEYPYDHLDTKIKSPTSKFGFMEPEGILNGSAINDLINSAIKIAKIIDLMLEKKLLLFFIIQKLRHWQLNNFFHHSKKVKCYILY